MYFNSYSCIVLTAISVNVTGLHYSSWQASRCWWPRLAICPHQRELRQACGSIVHCWQKSKCHF